MAYNIKKIKVVETYFPANEKPLTLELTISTDITTEKLKEYVETASDFIEAGYEIVDSAETVPPSPQDYDEFGVPNNYLREIDLKNLFSYGWDERIERVLKYIFEKENITYEFVSFPTIEVTCY